MSAAKSRPGKRGNHGGGGAQHGGPPVAAHAPYLSKKTGGIDSSNASGEPSAVLKEPSWCLDRNGFFK